MGAPLTTTRRDPMYSLTAFPSVFDEFFSDFLGRPMMTPAMPPDIAPIARARMDVVDKGGSFAVTVELPGVRKEDINVNIDGARVSITAETMTETPVKEGEKVLYTERSAKSYARSFELPVEVTDAGAEAAYENGVLTLTLPKRAPNTSRKLVVQ